MRRWISFDLFRTSGFPHTLQLKPAHMFREREQLRAAQWVLFPEYWQLNALVYGLGARVFPSQATYRIGHDKVEMTRAFQMVAPSAVPDTHILANTPLNTEWIWETMVRPFVAKLPKSSQGEGVWLIRDHREWRDYLARTDVLYVQEYLPIDRDLRIVVVGREIVASYWRLQGFDGFHNNLARGGEVYAGPVPHAALELVRRVAAQLDVNHAGFDVAMVGEQPYLLELNRLFGNRGIPGGEQRVRDAILSYLMEESRPETPDTPLGELPEGPDLPRVA